MDRLKPSDGLLVNYAVKVLGLEIIGRQRLWWLCAGCQERIYTESEWKIHRCEKLL